MTSDSELIVWGIATSGLPTNLELAVFSGRKSHDMTPKPHPAAFEASSPYIKQALLGENSDTFSTWSSVERVFDLCRPNNHPQRTAIRIGTRSHPSQFDCQFTAFSGLLSH